MRLNVFAQIAEHAYPLIGVLDAEPGNGEFVYNPQWVNDDTAFPIDPVHLPLKGGIFTTNRASGLFAAFEDSLPDDWGCKLLLRRYRLPSRVEPAVLLKVLGADAMGGLLFSETDSIPHKTDISAIPLDTLIKASENYEQNDDTPELKYLFEAGSSPGGARPKALFEHNAIHYIAKFPSIKDNYDIPKWEAASLDMAQLVGLNVPNRQLVKAMGKNILLLERFDLIGNVKTHRLSLQTLLGLEGFYFASYKDIKNIIATFALHPHKELEHFFKQMVFNAAIGNTDDHLKNFSAYINPKGSITMTPVYDILPNVLNNQDHCLNFDLDPWTPNIRTFEKLGRSWGIPKPKDIVIEILELFEKEWHSCCQTYDIPDEEWCRLSKDGEKRRKKIRAA